MRTSVRLFEDNQETKTLLKFIDESEQYIKTRYKIHCSNDDSCMTHCIDHALSNPKDKDFRSPCTKIHDRICEECLNVVKCFASIKSDLHRLPSSHEKEVAQYDVKTAEQKIMGWQQHILTVESSY